MKKVKFSVPVLPLGIYQHYKGGQYEVTGVALHSETLEPLVAYRPLYKAEMKLWVRPYEMFVGTVMVEGVTKQRFTKI